MTPIKNFILKKTRFNKLTHLINIQKHNRRKIVGACASSAESSDRDKKQQQILDQKS